MSLLITILRWLAVPVTLAAVAGGCILLVRWSVTVADARCESMVGGACVESWHAGMIEWAIYIGVVLALLLMTTLAAWIAPALKRPVTVLAGLLGVAPIVAGYFITGWGDLLLPILLASIAALSGIMLVWRKQGSGNVSEAG